VVDTLSAAEPAEKKLSKALSLVMPDLPSAEVIDGALPLLVGLDENSDMATKGKLPQVVTIGKQKLSMPLATLLSCQAGQSEGEIALAIFGEGQGLLRNCIFGGDVGDGTILERAYTWALGCAWAKATVPRSNSLRSLGQLFFSFEAVALQDGMKVEQGQPPRVFSKNSNVNRQGLDAIEDSVIYHVAGEGRGQGFHRGVDLWFKSEGKLILIDVAGTANLEECRAKAADLKRCVKAVQDFIDGEKKDANGLKEVYGVILAPNCRRDSDLEEEYRKEKVEVVAAEEARDLLGGLQQLLFFTDMPADD